MNKRGNIDTLTNGLVPLVFVIVVAAVIQNMLSDTKCQVYKTQVANCEQDKTNLQGQTSILSSKANFYKEQYENLTTTNITKKDFTDLKQEINTVSVQISNIQNQITQVNENVISIQNVKNVYQTLVVSIVLNFLFFGFLMLDFAVFNFEISKKIIGLMLEKLNKLKEIFHKKKKEQHHHEQNKVSV